MLTSTTIPTDPRDRERSVALKIQPYELYDALDSNDRVERQLLSMLREDDTDDNLKKIGRLMWDMFERLVKRDIDNENAQLVIEARSERVPACVRLWDEV